MPLAKKDRVLATVAYLPDFRAFLAPIFAQFARNEALYRVSNVPDERDAIQSLQKPQFLRAANAICTQFAFSKDRVEAEPHEA